MDDKKQSVYDAADLILDTEMDLDTIQSSVRQILTEPKMPTARVCSVRQSGLPVLTRNAVWLSHRSARTGQ